MENDELSKEVRQLGFPIEHKHKLCCLRQELLENFIDSRYMMFIKFAAYHLQQLNLKKVEEQEEKDRAIESAVEEINKDESDENKKDDTKEKNIKVLKKGQIEEEEAKKIVESVTGTSKLECKNMLNP